MPNRPQLFHCKPFDAYISQTTCEMNQRQAAEGTAQLQASATPMQVDEQLMSRVTHCIPCPQCCLGVTEQDIARLLQAQSAQYIQTIQKWLDPVGRKKQRRKQQATPLPETTREVEAICDEHFAEDGSCMRGSCPLATICVRGRSGEDKAETYIQQLNEAAKGRK